MPTQAAEHFGGLLKRYRGLAGLTQEQLAERAGLSTRGLQDLENGRSRAPHTATVQLLIEALALAPDDRARLEAALRHQPAPGEPGMVGVPSTHTPRQSGFARPPWPLIGRVREREALASLLRRGDVRLVTLTGVGGVGKTRLALEVASDMSGSFADGALFVSLAAIRDPALVLSAIAQAVGLQEIGGRPLADMLQAYFRERQVLLLLDNLEQVAAAAPQIGALLQACPGMVV